MYKHIYDFRYWTFYVSDELKLFKTKAPTLVFFALITDDKQWCGVSRLYEILTKRTLCLVHYHLFQTSINDSKEALHSNNLSAVCDNERETVMLRNWKHKQRRRNKKPTWVLLTKSNLLKFMTFRFSLPGTRIRESLQTIIYLQSHG